MSRSRADEIFLEVCDAPPGERGKLLDELCGDDAGLRAEVDRLLRSDEPDDDWLEETDVHASATLSGILTAAAGPAAPDRVAAYRVIETIGAGGMGTVYLAEQDQPRRRVALKMIRAGVMTQELRKRFRAEAEMLGRLKHPGIAQIYDAGETAPEDGSRPWFAMEYVEGRGLLDYAERRALDRRDRLELTARIADAVQHAHSRGVVHRDLKPENILVVPDTGHGPGQPKILDFGVARAIESDVQLTTMHTTAGEILGTLNYMSPEQIGGRHDEVDGRSDVYALGVILHEVLAGRPPRDLRGKTIVEAALSVERESAPRLGTVHSSFRGDVETIAGKALEGEIDRRYASAAEFAADIRRHLADEPISARPPSTRYQLRRFARKHRGLVAGLAAAFAILVAGVVVSSLLAVRAGRQAERAEAREAESRRATYRFSVAAAEAICESDPRRALLHLAEAPEEHRGFEWRLVEARCRSHFVHRRGGRHLSDSAVLARDEEGRLLAARMVGTEVVVVEVASGRERGRVPVEDSRIELALSPDGGCLAVWFTEQGRLVVFRVGDGKRLLDLPVGANSRAGPLFSPSGARMAIPTADSVRVVDLATGDTVFRYPTGTDHPRAIAFDPRDDRLIVAVSDARPDGDGDAVRFSALGTTGELRAEAVHGPHCESIAVSPDGRRIAVGARRRVLLLDGDTLELLSTPIWLPTFVHALAFSPDGRWLAAASLDGSTRLLDLESGEGRTLLSMEDATALAFSGDGRRLAAATSAEVKAWETTPTAMRVLTGHGSYVYQVAFSADGSLLASSDYANSVLVRDRWSGEVRCRGESPRARIFLAFARDGTGLLVARGKDVDRRDPITWARRGSSLFDEFGIATVNDRPWCIDYGSGRILRGRDGEMAVKYDRAGPVTIDRNRVEIARLETASDGPVAGVAISPDRAFVLTGHRDGTVRRWDLETTAEQTRGDGHTGKVHAIAYSPDGSRVATGAEDGLVLIRDAKTLDVLLHLGTHRSYVHGLTFSPDGRALASASGDGTVRLWETTLPTDRPR